MKPYLKLFSPAKINLFFKILYKRKDGYHEIASLYQAINLFDIFNIRLSDKDSFKCNNKSLIFDKSNLIYNAVELFKKKSGISFCVDIILEKNIPMQAGLGGGSSNAATTLYAINKLLDFPLSNKQILEIASEIGSDVSFFFSSGTSYCTGRGEIFRDITPQNISLYLAVPSFGVSTKSVYAGVNVNKLNDNDQNTSLFAFENGELKLFNDLEISAFTFQPKLKDVKNDILNMGFESVIMTGSGSAFLCFGSKLFGPNSFGTNINNIKISFYKIESIQRNSNSWYSNII